MAHSSDKGAAKPLWISMLCVVDVGSKIWFVETNFYTVGIRKNQTEFTGACSMYFIYLGYDT